MLDSIKKTCCIVILCFSSIIVIGQTWEEIPVNTLDAADPFLWFSVNDKIVFSARHTDNKNYLWFTDGSIENTTRLETFPFSRYHQLSNIIELSSTVYFIINRELYKTDGTMKGTQKVSFQNRILSAKNSGPLHTFHDKLILTDGYSQSDIYNNEPHGFTSVLADDIDSAIRIGPAAFSCINYDQQFFYSAKLNRDSASLWVSDGTKLGTKMVSKMYSEYPSNINEFVVHQGFLYFVNNGSELWRTSGTSESTMQVGDVKSIGKNYLEELTSFQDNIFFTCGDFGGGPIGVFENDSIFLFSKKNANTVWLGDKDKAFNVIGDKLFISLYEQADVYPGHTLGTELWVTDGTKSNLKLLKDINPINDYEEGSSYPTSYTVANSRIYFNAKNGINSYQLWSSDGSSLSTVMHRPHLNMENSILKGSENGRFLLVKDDIYVVADYTDPGTRNIWKFTTPKLSSESVSRNFHVYPNPASQEVILRNFSDKTALYDFYGQQGKLEFTTEVSPNTDIVVDITSLNPGIYFIKNSEGEYFKLLKI